MRRFFLRKKVIILIVIVVLIVTQLAFFESIRDGARTALRPTVEAFAKSSNAFGSGIRLWRSVTKLSRENIELRQQNNELQAQVAQLETIAIENYQLKKDLAFQNQNQQFSLLPATLTGSFPGTSYQVFFISKGSDDGVREGQIVVSQGYLIGKVKKVAPKSAEIWQLSNRNQLTPVIMTSSQTTGILRGGIRGLVVENIPINSGVKKGEYVTTSALEGLYPAGVLVGQVEEILSKKEDIFLTVRVSNPVNVGTITVVFVVLENK